MLIISLGVDHSDIIDSTEKIIYMILVMMQWNYNSFHFMGVIILLFLMIRFICSMFVFLTNWNHENIWFRHFNKLSSKRAVLQLFWIELFDFREIKVDESRCYLNSGLNLHSSSCKILRCKFFNPTGMKEEPD